MKIAENECEDNIEEDIFSDLGKKFVKKTSGRVIKTPLNDNKVSNNFVPALKKD